MRFNNIIGNDAIKNYLNNSIEQNSLLHSYLFLGTDGIGKKQIAMEFARKVLCLEEGKDDCSCKSCLCIEGDSHPDYFFYDKDYDTHDSKVNNYGVNFIRDYVIKPISNKWILSPYRIVIIDEFDRMTPQAQNCLLKTLEEPLDNVIFILISSNENLIINTIKSRCMTLKFHNIEDEKLLKYAKENLEYTEISNNMLKAFDGSIGKAIKQKDFQDKVIRIDEVVSSLESKDIIDIMLDAKPLFEKEIINDILDYLVVSLFSKRNEDEHYIDAIKCVNKCAQRLKASANYDMSIDNLLMEMWEELNENSNRC